MIKSLGKGLHQLDLEERILNASSIFALVSVFFPWISGEWLGGAEENFSGIEFFQSAIGFIVLILHACIIAITVVPLFGGNAYVKGKRKEIVRMFFAIQASVLTLAALSVLTKVTFETARMEVRFGIYCTFVGSIVTAFYGFLKYQEYIGSEPENHFHHPEDHEVIQPQHSESSFPMPPPPRPSAPEEHRMHR